ncbi:hypothetical protein NDU88_003020 [Pleurodeles waltl]|uniref:Uncharacterized protein n=1 Tax=Pleurodeles waltl TaxID=8319 RepID=A0AAV7UZF4_PLEWA|nr:hypothetical protein NDU88_003020 [Pleurodeles waltl]
MRTNAQRAPPRAASVPLSGLCRCCCLVCRGEPVRPRARCVAVFQPVHACLSTLARADAPAALSTRGVAVFKARLHAECRGSGSFKARLHVPEVSVLDVAGATGRRRGFSCARAQMYGTLRVIHSRSLRHLDRCQLAHSPQEEEWVAIAYGHRALQGYKVMC